MHKNIHNRVRNWNSWSLQFLKVMVDLIESVIFDCTDLKVVGSKPCRCLGKRVSTQRELTHVSSDNVHMFLGGMSGGRRMLLRVSSWPYAGVCALLQAKTMLRSSQSLPLIFTTHKMSKNYLHVTDQETNDRKIREVCLTPKPLLLTAAPSCPYTLIFHG